MRTCHSSRGGEQPQKGLKGVQGSATRFAASRQIEVQFSERPHRMEHKERKRESLHCHSYVKRQKRRKLTQADTPPWRRTQMPGVPPVVTSSRVGSRRKRVWTTSGLACGRVAAHHVFEGDAGVGHGGAEDQIQTRAATTLMAAPQGHSE